jgi:putative spermidine/putrescine transport system permease protein
MGDFVTVQTMSGGQSASVGVAMNNKRALLQYPAAAADAVILLIVVLIIVALLMRVVDLRKAL